MFPGSRESVVGVKEYLRVVVLKRLVVSCGNGTNISGADRKHVE